MYLIGRLFFVVQIQIHRERIMKINISTIENNNALSEIQSSTANEIIGGETTATVEWNSLTVGETSGQDLVVERFYAVPNQTDLVFTWNGWS